MQRGPEDDGVAGRADPKGDPGGAQPFDLTGLLASASQALQVRVLEKRAGRVHRDSPFCACTSARQDVNAEPIANRLSGWGRSGVNIGNASGAALSQGPDERQRSRAASGRERMIEGLRRITPRRRRPASRWRTKARWRIWADRHDFHELASRRLPERMSMAVHALNDRLIGHPAEGCCGAGPPASMALPRQISARFRLPRGRPQPSWLVSVKACPGQGTSAHLDATECRSSGRAR